MNAAQSFKTTAFSAIETAQACYRQAVKDTATVYRIARPIVLCAAAVLYVLGSKSYAAGKRFRAWSDHLVESNLVAIEAEVEIAPAEVKPIAQPVEQQEEIATPVQDLKSLKVPQLQKIATDLGISIRAKGADRRLNKAELLEAIAAVSV